MVLREAAIPAAAPLAPPGIEDLRIYAWESWADLITRFDGKVWCIRMMTQDAPFRTVGYGRFREFQFYVIVGHIATPPIQRFQ